jgi:hypothetical protein
VSKSKDYTVDGLVIGCLRRLDCSINGNPAYWVYFTNGSDARTMSDAGVSYEIGNPEYRNVPLRVLFTPAGRVRGVEVMK